MRHNSIDNPPDTDVFSNARQVQITSGTPSHFNGLYKDHYPNIAKIYLENTDEYPLYFLWAAWSRTWRNCGR